MSGFYDAMIILAKIGRAHGVKGGVRVQYFGNDPDGISQYCHVTDCKTGKVLEIVSARVLKNNLWVVHFKGFDNREAVQALCGHDIGVARDALPVLEEEDSFYHADLIGLEVLNDAGDVVGHVKAIHNFGADDLLDIAPETGQSWLLPFTKSCVPIIDFDHGLIVIHPPEVMDGTDDLQDPDKAEDE
jgi:16S rRNA processing protein RimM